jgi:hypothetical protein
MTITENTARIYVSPVPYLSIDGRSRTYPFTSVYARPGPHCLGSTVVERVERVERVDHITLCHSGERGECVGKKKRCKDYEYDTIPSLLYFLRLSSNV